MLRENFFSFYYKITLSQVILIILLSLQSRGTFWANYSTTLGAALHELGHCFDLMHMPEGIMARGFDDMNRFVVATPSSRHCPCPAQSTGITSAVATAMGMFADHRAHWFRSSAVLLHYHR